MTKIKAAGGGNIVPLRPPLQSGSGGGTFDDMEARVAKLEAHAEYIRRDIEALRADTKALGDKVQSTHLEMTKLTERVAHLPSKDFIVKALLTGLAVIAALITFQTHIQKLVTGG